ncbi:MAG: type II secretion system protein [Planctomycetota bacterium]|nr:type II secretion system protein [Planctomycetota bacterium]MDA1105599.1 type II secretion system protein [Planctomycetota bacterium]
MTRDRRAFTLIEVIIAVTIVAIMAAIVLPRINRISRARGEVAVAQAEQLLSALAYRDSTGSRQVGLMREAGSPDVFLVVMDEAVAEEGERAAWRREELVLPLRLGGEIELLDVLVDGEPISPDEFLVSTIPGSIRPSIALVLSNGGAETTVTLLPTALRPRKDSDASSNELADLRALIDLDAEGRDQDPW